MTHSELTRNATLVPQQVTSTDIKKAAISAAFLKHLVTLKSQIG